MHNVGRTIAVKSCDDFFEILEALGRDEMPATVGPRLFDLAIESTVRIIGTKQFACP